MKELAFELILEQRTIAVNLETELKIDVANVDQELVDQPSKYAWYSAIYEHLSHIVNKLKVLVSETEARIVDRIRSDAQLSGQSRPTEKMIDAEMKLDPEWQEMQNLLLEAQRNMNLARVAKEAFQQRRDMLISLVSIIKEERQWSQSSKILKDKHIIGLEQ